MPFNLESLLILSMGAMLTYGTAQTPSHFLNYIILRSNLYP